MSAIADLLNELRADPHFSDRVARWEVLPSRPADERPIPEGLHPALASALERRGIGRLYSHQEEAYLEAVAGHDVVVVTPTASGKTLAYNLPVLQRLLDEPAARAMYLFPTKALSQDQQAELNESVLSGDLGIRVVTYDGDTPASVRASARQKGQIIITNPDMLHSGILPNHTKWVKFFGSLRFVVIDELHTYRGVFGSHMTNLIRRLRRVCRHYGATPQFVCTSATIGNPKELAERILERPVVLVDKNGAARGERHVILYNPPIVDRVQGIRRGTVNEASGLALRFLKAGVKTIVFARSRVRVELIADYIRRALRNRYTDDSRISVESYRGGYLPNERRRIERGLRDGSVQGVVSTNALELGIDIGGLDASVLAGFPGSIASSWQQTGRAGRRGDVSVSVIIASSSPRDQYLVTNPEYFFGSSPESGFVNPDNVYILNDHLKCAVFELPMQSIDPVFGDVSDHLGDLEAGGLVRLSGRRAGGGAEVPAEGRYHWSDQAYPAEGVSLRSAASDNVVIVDVTGGKTDVIGETDRPGARETLFDNAVYIHGGVQYIVRTLDLENRRCEVERTDVDYYTDALTKRDIHVLTEDVVGSFAAVRTIVGDISVQSDVSQFKKIRFRTHENVGYGQIALPEEMMHTRALMIIFESSGDLGAVLAELDPVGRTSVVARLGAVIKNVAPVFLMCDPGDIGVSERLCDPHFELPTLYVFDMYPGGTGLAETLALRLAEVVAAADRLVRRCPCSEGCPSCIGPRDPQTEIDADPKALMIRFLGLWHDAIVAGSARDDGPL